MTLKGTPSSDNIYLGAGEIYFDRIDNKTGLHTGERHLGNCTTFNITSESEQKKKYSSMHAARRLYKSIITQIGASGKISMDEFDPENLALALFGESGVYVQPAQANLSKAITVKQGRYFALDNYNVSNVVIPNLNPAPSVIAPAVAAGAITSDGVVTSSGLYTGTITGDYFILITAGNTVPGAIAGTTFKWRKGIVGVQSADVTAGAVASTLELGIKVLLDVTGTQNFVVGDTYKISVVAAGQATFSPVMDYTVDAKLGRVYIVPGGGMADGSVAGVQYDCAKTTCVKVMAGNTAKIEGFLRFAGDPTTGPTYVGEFWYVSIQPDGDTGFIAEDWGSMGIKFECQDASADHPDEPFYRLLNL